MKVNIYPFGEVDRGRLDIARRYKLVESGGGVWRMTKKCTDNYDRESFVLYLDGTIDKPKRISSYTKRQIVINELLSL